MAHRIGIVGAGQLGAYLCRAARALGDRTHVIAQSAADPAAALADALTIADLSDSDAIAAMARQVDVVTFELEDVPVETLQAVADGMGASGYRIGPTVDSMLLLQNKAHQKQWLKDRGFPTADFVSLSADASCEAAIETLGLPLVVKAARGGYDGLGVCVAEDPVSARQFDGISRIAEAYVHDKRELAVIVARNWKGETAVYPVCEAEFNGQGNVLSNVVFPARISEAIRPRSS